MPSRVPIAGFDDSPESRIVEPKLTNVHIPGWHTGLNAARTMLNRIDIRQLPYQMVYVKTELKLRDPL